MTKNQLLDASRDNFLQQIGGIDAESMPGPFPAIGLQKKHYFNAKEMKNLLERQLDIVEVHVLLLRLVELQELVNRNHEADLPSQALNQLKPVEQISQQTPPVDQPNKMQKLTKK